MTSVLIKDATVLTQNDTRQRLHGDIYIENTIISEISERPISLEADYVLDGTHKVVLPGFINTHTHIPMTILRGYADDMVLNEWLAQRIWPVEAKLKPESIAAGTKLGLMEMIATGTTSFLDMYFFEDTIATISEEVGVRAFPGFALIDAGTPEYAPQQLLPSCERFIKRWNKHHLIQPVIAPHGVYTCGSETLLAAQELADKHDVYLHIHCSETRDEVYDVQNKYGIRPLGQLNKLGLLHESMILAHCGWMTKTEVMDIARAGSKVAHCPVSNMKIATGGYAPIPEFLEADVCVSLGTDGAASNNSLDMFDTMKFCALMHKQHRWDPKILPAQTVLDLATVKGAECLGIQDRVGSLEEGKQADLIMVDFHKPHLTPCHDVVSHLVYAATGQDVCTTLVKGQPLLLDYMFQTLKPDDVMSQAQQCAKDLTTQP
jgi:5-methylthioadenosine/S-adenosylhomocysteine deaminase